MKNNLLCVHLLPNFLPVYILDSGKIGPFSNLAAICQHCNQRYTSLSECYPQIVATAGNLAGTQTNVETIPDDTKCICIYKHKNICLYLIHVHSTSSNVSPQ